ncbi:serine/threonine phosphatase [Anabaena sp. UHCC 0399]|uniref:serine/threonine phosphatase n=1 Tax=Anabaena sp. UHCC 0399 TaxID=3110238 RepID=UPI002B20A4BC|nr:serine/threonine phosphatase [Anabaena sp. UHCC 0399]MEA5567118.1 serine/threonine phosphatase [Anabaena sp. UHCC 0399]
MLICPECQFENPNANKFCQKCGASLSYKVCPKCSTDVPVNALQCHNCGADCGTVWWAIVKKEGIGELAAPSGDKGQWGLEAGGAGEEKNIDEEMPDALFPMPNDPVLSPQFSVGSYLDQEQRYQFLATPLPQNAEVCARVLDCQPYQVSLVETILANQRQGLIAPVTEPNGIPKIAEAYISLQSPHHPEIPKIHDAWQDGDVQVILIEDRSDWQSLLDSWKKETTSSSQILHWCYQMTQLWVLLEPLNCHYSLLDLSNLRLDEDQSLGLQRLYAETRDNQISSELQEEEEEPLGLSAEPLTLKALGRVWQALFRSSQRTQFGLLIQVLDDLEQGTIQTIAQLRSRLQEVATELEVTTSPIFQPMEAEQTTSPTLLQVDDFEDSASRADDLPTVVLSVQLSSLEDAGCTDVGRQRQHNQDCFGIATKIEKVDLPKNRFLQAQGLYILCDGMGGHAGGEVASELAVQTLRQYFQEHWNTHQLPTEEIIREAVYLANEAIYQQNQQDARSGVGRMGTTLVMLLIQGNQAAVAHVGDSRLYRLTRKRGLEQLTVDHEVGQREINKGVEASIAYSRPDAYQLTQALGPRDESAINPDVEFFDINEDSLFILVSDGLSDNDLLETYWETHLQPLLSFANNLEQGVTGLIDLANQYNGHDNITAILIRAKVRPNVGSKE